MLTATPLTELTQAPLAALFGPVVAYNVIFLLSFFLTALFTYLLCYDLTGNRWASLAGGLIFAFSPFRVIHAAAGHFTQSMTYWFPLYAMFMLRVVRKPTARDAVLAGVFMACSALVSLMHIAYFVIPFTLAALLYGYLSDRAGFLTAARLKFLGAGAGGRRRHHGALLRSLPDPEAGGRLGISGPSGHGGIRGRSARLSLAVAVPSGLQPAAHRTLPGKRDPRLPVRESGLSRLGAAPAGLVRPPRRDRAIVDRPWRRNGAPGPGPHAQGGGSPGRATRWRTRPGTCSCLTR